MMDRVPQAFSGREWWRSPHPGSGLVCTTAEPFIAHSFALERYLSDLAPSKEQNKCVCRLLIHLSSDVSALGCSTLTSVGVWVQIHCLFVPLTLVDSVPELPSVITLSCLCKYRLSLKEKQMHLSNISSEKCGCRFQEKTLSQNSWL